MDNQRVLNAAAELYRQHQAGEPASALDESLAPATIEEAYAVQEAFIKENERAGLEIVGWKVALTSSVMQELVGIGEPTAGAIFSSRVHTSPATLHANQYVNLGVESEIAVRIKDDMTGEHAPYDRSSVRKFVAACMPATELVDDRRWDYKAIRATDLVADNSFSYGCVLGPAHPNWEELTLEGLAGKMIINQATVGEGHGGDALGHPCEPVAWLANHLLARGRMLRADDIVLTGSIVATRWLNAGDTMTTVIEELGEAELRVV